MSHSSRPRADGFSVHCAAKANELQQHGLGQINGATVAFLLEKTARKRTARHDCIARILRAADDSDGTWQESAIQAAYRLRKLTDAALAELDPSPPAPAPVPAQFDQLAELNRQLESQIKTQSAPHR